jgi:hypothetical protein
MADRGPDVQPEDPLPRDPLRDRAADDRPAQHGQPAFLLHAAAGAGVSMAYPAVQNAVVGAVAPSELGKASGTYNAMRQLGGAFGVAIAVAPAAEGRTAGVRTAGEVSTAAELRA